MTALPVLGRSAPADHALAQVEQGVVALNACLPAELDQRGCDAPSLALLLGELRGVRQRVAQLEAFTERALATAMTGDVLTVPGVLHAERRRGAKRTDWRHDEVAHAVAGWAVVDRDTGELGDATTAHRTASALLNAARPEWRVRQLRAMAIDPGDYCTTALGHTTVSVILGGDVA